MELTLAEFVKTLDLSNLEIGEKVEVKEEKSRVVLNFKVGNPLGKGKTLESATYTTMCMMIQQDYKNKLGVYSLVLDQKPKYYLIKLTSQYDGRESTQIALAVQQAGDSRSKDHFVLDFVQGFEQGHLQDLEEGTEEREELEAVWNFNPVYGDRFESLDSYTITWLERYKLITEQEYDNLYEFIYGTDFSK